MKRYYGFLLVFAVALMFSFAGCDGNVPAATGPAPAAPTGLQALDITDSGAMLEWDSVTDADQAVMYEVLRGSERLIRSYDLSYTATGLTPYTTYVFYVSSVNRNGVSPSQVIVRTAPTAPSGIGVTEATTSGLTVYWEEKDGADGYNVYRSERSDGGFTQVNITGLVTDSYTEAGAKYYYYNDTGLDSGKTYYYKVSSVLESEESNAEDAESASSAAVSGKTETDN